MPAVDKISRFAPALLAVGLLVWIGLLRGHSLDESVWNVDETIHATIANVLLDGGVLYEDAIDQRSPLTYYATAAVFAVAGSSLFALRIFAMGMIIAAAWFLGRTVWRLYGVAAGIGATGVFAALSNYLLHAGDTFAVHTEWYVVFFSTAALWAFFGGANAVPSIRRSAVAGGLLGLAVMSKQSALLELVCPIVALAFVWLDGLLDWKQSLARILAVAAGAVVSGFTLIAPSILSGAGEDLLYYTWTYNIEIYGAEFTFAEKLISGGVLLDALASHYPVLLVLAMVTVTVLSVRSVQIHPVGSSKPGRFVEAYLVCWFATTLGAAMAGGRGFEHYFFPTFAPIAWLCVWGPTTLWRRIQNSTTAVPVWLRAVSWIAIGGLVYSFAIPPLAALKTPPPAPDASLRISAWMKSQSKPNDRIFIWGFNPDIYHYTDRLPASRFVYCTFQTGLIPWTNTDPDIDTTYAIVPGAMETLLEDLGENPPRFFVDSSAGPHRLFQKYQIDEFPKLHSWLHQHYAEMDPAQFSGQGFRIFVRIDEPVVPAGVKWNVSESAPVYMEGYDLISDGMNHVRVVFRDTEEIEVSGLGLKRDGEVLAAFELHTDEAANARIPINVDADAEQIELQPIVRIKGGQWQAGLPHRMEVGSNDITENQKIEFAVPVLNRRVAAAGLRSFFGARREIIDGVRTFAIHAPATLTYEIPADANFLSGKFGLPHGAYRDENPTPSDGAEFIIRLSQNSGKPIELFRRLIEPRTNPDDVGEHEFRVEIPPVQPGELLELEITAGPSGVASSDWTYWADLVFETSL